MLLKIYTDGSCLGNPGSGGWAAICDKFTVCGSDGPKTTNNIMELTAVIAGLQKALDIGFRDVQIYTDSNYVKKGIMEWATKWEKNGWMTSTGTPVKNKQLWVKLVELTKKFMIIEWTWVKAHNGNINNERVDKLARRCAELVKEETQ